MSDSTKKIVTWMKAHPYFSFTSMCNDLGIDQGNFSRTIKTGKPGIRDENVVKIEAVLVKYGYLAKEAPAVSKAPASKKDPVKTAVEKITPKIASKQATPAVNAFLEGRRKQKGIIKGAEKN